jgi:hypothetical protein
MGKAWQLCGNFQLHRLNGRTAQLTLTSDQPEHRPSICVSSMPSHHRWRKFHRAEFRVRSVSPDQTNAPFAKFAWPKTLWCKRSFICTTSQKNSDMGNRYVQQSCCGRRKIPFKILPWHAVYFISLVSWLQAVWRDSCATFSKHWIDPDTGRQSRYGISGRPKFMLPSSESSTFRYILCLVGQHTQNLWPSANL